MSLKNKIVVLAGGTGAIGSSVAHMLLRENATLIVPAKSKNDLLWVNEVEKAKRDSITTLLADYLDFYKAAEILDEIRERYGKIDLIIACFESSTIITPLIKVDITDWERMIEQDITAFFVAARLSVNAMLQNDQGMLITIDATPSVSNKTQAKLAHLSTHLQKEMAKMFYEETKNTCLKYYHLFIDESTKSVNSSEINNRIHPEDSGAFILQLYNGTAANEAELLQWMYNESISG